jgi:hypothetical protein
LKRLGREKTSPSLVCSSKPIEKKRKPHDSFFSPVHTIVFCFTIGYTGEKNDSWVLTVLLYTSHIFQTCDCSHFTTPAITLIVLFPTAHGLNFFTTSRGTHTTDPGFGGPPMFQPFPNKVPLHN